jgi:hypothetical protein
MKNLFFEIHMGVNKLSIKLMGDRELVIDPDMDHWLWHEFYIAITTNLSSVYMEGLGFYKVPIEP